LLFKYKRSLHLCKICTSSARFDLVEQPKANCGKRAARAEETLSFFSFFYFLSFFFCFFEYCLRMKKDLSKPPWNRMYRKACPRCGTKMPYRRVNGKMKEWSPCKYAWYCTKCPEVCFLDGSIDPKDTSTWEHAQQKRKTSALYRSINAALKAVEKENE